MNLPRLHRRLARRLRALLLRRAVERELDEELRFHLAMEIEHNMTLGLTPAEARARAEREFGGVERAKEEARDARGTRALEELGRDLRLAARALRRAPAYTLVALLTLALGIGAGTAVFTLVDGVLLRPLPYPAPERLMRVFERTEQGARVSFAGANFHDAQRGSRAFAGMAYFSSGSETILGADRPMRATGALVSPGFFDVLGVRPMLGRAPAPDEGRAGGPGSVVISHGFWQGALGGDPAWQRRTLRVGDGALAIVGIMPPGFDYPTGTQLWVAHVDDNPHRTAHNWSVIGRLAPGATPAQARQELDALFGALKAQLGRDIDATGATVVPLHDVLAGGVRTPLLVLAGAVAFVLLVACVNLASANLARGEARHRELALRVALGAGRGRLVRQLLTENLLLAATGGALGVGLAWLLVRAVLAFGPGTLPGFARLALDLRVLLFAAGVSLLTGLLIGIAPALASTRDLRGAIGQGSAGALGGRRGRARRVLIGAEVAFAVALLAGAGLLVKSLRTLLDEETGFRADGVITADLALPFATYGDSAGWSGDTLKVAAFFDRLLPSLRALPGVEEVGLVNQVPLGGGGMASGFMVDGGTEVVGGADYQVVDSSYFAALGIPLLRGRGFGAADRAGAPHAAVINQAMADRYWPGQDPLGHRVRLPGMDAHRAEWLTIVGVVGNVRHAGLDRAYEPQLFIHYPQRPERLVSGATVVVRAATPPAGLVDALRGRVAAVDADVPVEVSSLQALVDRSVATRRFSTTVLGGFAALATFLAAIGIYGVLAYSVAQRRREIGVRMALGARHGTVRAMVLREAMRAVLPGVLAGLAGAVALTRVLRGLLYGVSETDPATFAAVALLLTAVAAAASWIPARRATRVDPMVAIREP